MKQKLNYWIANSPIGKMLLGATDRGLCAAAFGGSEKEVLVWLGNRFPGFEAVQNHAIFVKYYPAVKEYFDGQRREFNVLLDLQGTEFQQRVWAELLAIPFGETRSYQEIADKMGSSKSVRAVATACGANPIALFVPCHRVIGGKGEISGYRWGVERKKQLLELEKNFVSGKAPSQSAKQEAPVPVLDWCLED